MQDIRYAIRSLRKQPIFSLVAVITLTLGIGANTAIFSLLYQILLRPLPYPDAERLVFIWNTYPGINLAQASVSIPDYIDRKTQAPAIEDATLITMRTANLNEGGNPEQLRSLAVTPSFFSTLQRQPFLGRGFTEDEAKPDADKYAILTYALWSSHYGSSRDIVGKDIRINGEAHRVVGVFRLTSSYLPGNGLARAVLVHAAADVRQCARQRVQPDGGSAQAGRHHCAGERAVQDHRRPQHRASACARGLRQIQRLRGLRGLDAGADRRGRPRPSVPSAGRRDRRAVHRLRQRRQPAADARDRPSS